MSNPRRLAALFFAVLTATGCQDLIGLTSGKSADTGGAGGTTATSSTGGGATGGGVTGGTGGSGGTTGGSATGGKGGTGGSADCPEGCQSTICQKATCVEGKCLFDYAPAGKPVQDPAPSDCKADFCDGNGNLVKDAPWDDDADDKSECTWDACSGGISGHAPKRDGTHCQNGVCEGGQCVAVTCFKDGMKGQKETDVDCGGPCDPCQVDKACRVNADCGTGFCSGSVAVADGKCAEPVALALTVNTAAGESHVVLGTFNFNGVPTWTTTQSAALTGLGVGTIGFDPGGQGVGAVRNGNNGAQWARWSTAVGWQTKGAWLLGAAGTSNSWFPVMTTTDDALSLFAQNFNQQHFRAYADANAGKEFLVVDGATSAFSGGAVTRQGHASFFTPSGTAHLVEQRFLGGAWAPPVPILDGNYADGQPAAAALPGVGALVVAIARSESGDHTFDWVLLPDAGPPQHGTIAGPKILSPTAPPRRYALAARASGGAVFAYRKIDGDANSTLDVWLANIDAGGMLTWKQADGVGNALNAPLAAIEPSAARGIGGEDAEILCVSTSPANVRHFRIAQNGKWTVNESVVLAAGTTVAIATP